MYFPDGFEDEREYGMMLMRRLIVTRKTRKTTKDHEMVLYEYSPENKDAEDSTVLDVLKVAEMTIKMVDALKLRLGSELMDRYAHYCYLSYFSLGTFSYSL